MPNRTMIRASVLAVCIGVVGVSVSAQERRAAQATGPSIEAAGIDRAVAPAVTSLQTALSRASADPAYLQALERGDSGTVQEILALHGASGITIGSITGAGGSGTPVIQEWKITITIKLSRPAEISVSFEK